MKIQSPQWRTIAAIWIAVAAMLTVIMYFVFPRSSGTFDWSAEFTWELAIAIVWIFATPVVLSLAQKFPLEAKSRALRLLLHLLLSLIASVVLCVIHGFVVNVLRLMYSAFSWHVLIQSLYYNIDKMVIMYWVVLLVHHAHRYYTEFQEKKFAAARLESELTKAQLRALQMQLQPHFLFNTLNAISVLIKKKPDAARTMLTRLSTLLRMTLESNGEHRIPLRKEIEFLQGYLHIEKVRFGERLEVTSKFETDVLDAMVPTFILQPLVENSIRHGIAKKSGKGVIEISGRRADDTLTICIHDNGRGIRRESHHNGVGVGNTTARLQQLYGTAFSFSVRHDEDGTTVDITIPFSTS